MNPNDLFEHAAGITLLQTTAMNTAVELERRRMLPVFEQVFVAYRRALGDPKAKIPTPLHVAIANAQRFVGELKDGQDEHKAVLGADALVREPA